MTHVHVQYSLPGAAYIDDSDDPAQLHALAANRFGIVGSTRKREKTCQHLLLLVVFLGMVVWNIALISQAIQYGNYKRFIQGRDSFGNTCGEGAFVQRTAVFYFSSNANSLRICVHSCPISAGDASTAQMSGLCLPQHLWDNVSTSLAVANGIVVSGQYVGCPTHYDASTTILSRCTPNTHVHAIDGWHVDVVADAIAGWKELGGAIIMGVVAPLILSLLRCTASV